MLRVVGSSSSLHHCISHSLEIQASTEVKSVINVHVSCRATKTHAQGNGDGSEIVLRDRCDIFNVENGIQRDGLYGSNQCLPIVRLMLHNDCD